MLKISLRPNGYKVSISYRGTGKRGYSVHARNIEEVHHAINHVYLIPDRRCSPDTCPFCRLAALQERRKAK